MKKILIGATLILASFAYTGQAEAQIRFGINFNIGNQPDWGPAGYNSVQYYYLPDIDAYYYVPSRQFIYMSGGRWVFSASLPSRYRNYDLYSGYKVVVNEPNAYLRHDYHMRQYSRYRGNHSQVIIRNSNDSRYRNNNNSNNYNRNGRNNDRRYNNH